MSLSFLILDVYFVLTYLRPDFYDIKKFIYNLSYLLQNCRTYTDTKCQTVLADIINQGMCFIISVNYKRILRVIGYFNYNTQFPEVQTVWRSTIGIMVNQRTRDLFVTSVTWDIFLKLTTLLSKVKWYETHKKDDYHSSWCYTQRLSIINDNSDY